MALSSGRVEDAGYPRPSRLIETLLLRLHTLSSRLNVNDEASANIANMSGTDVGCFGIPEKKYVRNGKILTSLVSFEPCSQSRLVFSTL